MSNDQITLANAPAISGLRFRHYRGESDYPFMVAALLSSAEADKIERKDTVEDMANNYNYLTDCDPHKDMIFTEIAGQVVGYSRGWWWDEPATGRIKKTWHSQPGLWLGDGKIILQDPIRIGQLADQVAQPKNERDGYQGHQAELD